MGNSDHVCKGLRQEPSTILWGIYFKFDCYSWVLCSITTPVFITWPVCLKKCNIRPWLAENWKFIIRKLFGCYKFQFLKFISQSSICSSHLLSWGLGSMIKNEDFAPSYTVLLCVLGSSPLGHWHHQTFHTICQHQQQALSLNYQSDLSQCISVAITSYAACG